MISRTSRESTARTISRRMSIRRCVACGYDGALLQGGRAERCARCGCDLRRRPARSYAEMEGLVGHPVTVDSLVGRPRREDRLIHRWLAFLFISVLFMVTLGYFAAAAFGV